MEAIKITKDKEKIINIRDIKQLSKDSDFALTGIVTKIYRRLDRNNRPFWEIMVTDTTGDITGRAWFDSSWQNIQNGDKFPIDPDNCGFNFEGLSMGFIGRISDYKGQLQYNFTEIYILDQNKYPPKSFIKRSPLKQEFLEESFKSLINEISNETLKNFLNAIFFKHGLWEKFRTYPAAVTFHHAYTAGLLEHSVSVTLGARDMAEHYKNFNVPISIDLIIAGALLHDIGKTESYKNDTIPKTLPEASVIDHTVIGYHMFMKAAEIEKIDHDLTLALGHIILSHHGKFEYGAPVLPQTPEALIVNAADEIDFRVTFWRNQIENLNPQSDFTDYIPMLERRLWRGISLK